MTPEGFISALADLQFEDAFNPYSDYCEQHDRPDAPAVRRENLRLVLRAAIEAGVDSIWVARDLGYRGGRRTGLALTDEAHLFAHSNLYGRLPLAKATQGPAVAELTAKIVWAAIKEVGQPIFLWNVFPLHPYERGRPMSNRRHTRAERRASTHLLGWLLLALQPTRIVSIGRDAASALQETGVRPVTVRHPSYGGQREFTAGIANAYGLKVNSVDDSVQTLF